MEAQKELAQAMFLILSSSRTKLQLQSKEIEVLEGQGQWCLFYISSF